MSKKQEKSKDLAEYVAKFMSKMQEKESVGELQPSEIIVL